MTVLEQIFQKKDDASAPAETPVVQDKQQLMERKNDIEQRIKQVERKEVDDKITDSLQKLGDITGAIGDMQSALNLLWKRVKQIEEELNQALKL